MVSTVETARKSGFSEKDEFTIERHILARFKSTLVKMEKLPNFNIIDARSTIVWREVLQSMETRSKGLIKQLINAENDEPIEKLKTFPYRDWNDDWYEYFIRTLLLQVIDILVTKNAGKNSYTIFTDLWEASKNVSDPTVGKKLMNRMLAYHSFLLDKSIIPHVWLQKLREFSRSHTDEIEEFINTLEQKYEHACFVSMCFKTDSFKDICTKLYVDAYNSWLTDKTIKPPHVDSMCVEFQKYSSYLTITS